MKKRQINRRQFLQGVGGTMFTLPPLLSMLPFSAHAAPVGTVKRVILCPTLYGIDPADFFPKTPAANLQTKFANAKDVDVYSTPLSSFSTAGNLSVSLQAAFNDPVLRAKTNIYEGLDVTNGGQIVSHTYGSLAGTAKSAVPSLDSGRGPKFGESIDNTISKSPNFYSSTPQIPVLRISSCNDGTMWSFDRLNGEAQYKNFFMGDTAAFNKVFANVMPGTPAPSGPDPSKVYILDRILASLTGLQSSKRISAADKQLLDRYVTGVHSLQKSVNTNQQTAPACSKPSLSLQVTKSGNPWAFPGEINGTSWGVKSSNTMMNNLNDIIVNAFLCDITRVVVFGNALWQDAPVSNYTAGAQFHSHDDGTGGPLTTAEKHAWFLNFIASLAKKLDAIPDPLSSGGSLLDNSVILFTSEHGGVKSHSVFSIPTLTIGSAGGYFKTGYYVDCRQRPYTKDAYHESIGRPNKQLLISIMQAMGLQAGEYMSNGDGKGFGDFEITALGNTYSKFVNSHNDPLPFIKA